MRLSDILSDKPTNEYREVEGFLLNKKGIVGQQVKISEGKVLLNYFCRKCNNHRTFSSKGKLSCIFVSDRIISLDCVMTCFCGTNVQVWFLIESEDDIRSMSPKVRIIKRSEKLSDLVKINSNEYGEYSELLDLSERAYREGLGAGSIVYLRKIFEKITVQVATALKIEYERYEGGNPKNFKELLKKVDQRYSIIPTEFSENRYKLFGELSSIVHGDNDEILSLSKYDALRRLVVGILDNIKNRDELKRAIVSLGWKEEENKISNE